MPHLIDRASDIERATETLVGRSPVPDSHRRARQGRSALAGIALLLPLLLAACGTSASSATTAASTPGPSGAPGAGRSAGTGASSGTPMVKPPTATPLAQAPTKPEGDGTTVTLKTAKGDITIALYTKSAPVAAQNFENLAGAGFYDGTVFHRIVPGFVIQGGDPTGTGTGGPGYSFPDEPFAGDYTRGTVAMANAGPNTNGSQFFIVLADSPQLPKSYTIFGTVTAGMQVVDAIAAGPHGGPNGDTALQPVEIVNATVHQP